MVVMAVTLQPQAMVVTVATAATLQPQAMVVTAVTLQPQAMAVTAVTIIMDPLTVVPVVHQLLLLVYRTISRNLQVLCNQVVQEVEPITMCHHRISLIQQFQTNLRHLSTEVLLLSNRLSVWYFYYQYFSLYPLFES